MSIIPVVLSGVFYPKGKSADDVPMPGTFVGNAAIAGLGVGGGPIYPEEPPVDEDGHPTFPIWGPPGTDFPGIPGYPPVAGHPLPDPPPPVDPDNPDPIPNWETKVAWTPVTGWIVVLIPTGDHVVPSGTSRRR